MKKEYRIIGILTVSMALVLCGCGKKAEGENVPQTVSGQSTETLETVTELGPIEQFGLDILPTVQVEAGTECLGQEMFFEDYSGQKLYIATQLTPEELAVAGQTYPVDVIYEDHELTIDVEVIDTIAPTIAQVENIVVKAGNTIAYKKAIETSDNSSNTLDLQIDNSAVDAETPGTYNVVYTVTDAAGNSASTEVELTVVEAASHTEEDVKELAEKVIANVVKEGASQYETALALFQYVQWNVKYLHTSGDRSSVWAGAYEGLHDHAGDCYAFYATYAVLLTYCGIDNECVARIGGETNHWWNLVNVGDGWYHCDASPRRYGDGYYCFMQTDAQIAAYTEAYPEKPNYYTFDPNTVSERETEIIYGYSPETIKTKYCTDAVYKRVMELKNESSTTTTVVDIPEEPENTTAEQNETDKKTEATEKDTNKKKDTKKKETTQKDTTKKDKKEEADASDDLENQNAEEVPVETVPEETPVEPAQEAEIGNPADMVDVTPDAVVETE